jgi:hypothetical protein
LPKICFPLVEIKTFVCSVLCDCVTAFITFEILKFQGIKLFFQTLPLPQFLFYTRHGQSAARGPHAARQTFFAALEFKGARNLVK